MKRWTSMVAALLLAAAGAQSAEPSPRFDPEQQVGVEHVKQGSPGTEKANGSAGFGMPKNSDTDAPFDATAAGVTPEGTIVVPFLFTSDEPAPGSEAIMERAAAQLAAGSGPVQIAGHTSGAGEPKLNQRLSERRAQRVRQYLIDHGVAAERLTARGYGPTQPRATNDTRDGRRRNRRVEIKRG